MKKLVILLLAMHLAIWGEVLHWPYDQQYHNYAQRTNEPIGVLITAFNRPDYFKKTLAALEQTPESQTLPFFFVIDGGPRALQKEHAAIIEKSTIKKKHLILLDKNYGNGRNVLDSRRFMFEWCNFKKILVFEDDIVVTPEYITLTLRLHEWATKKYDNIGAVCCYNDCYLGEEEKVGMLHDIEETVDKYWGYCMDKKTYNETKALLDEYEQRCLIDIPLHKPNCGAIADWMLERMKSHSRKVPTKNSLRCIVDYEFYHRNHAKYMYGYAGKRRDGQDMETRFAFFMAGKIKISTTVNRALYIGMEGVHHTDELMQKNSIDHITLTRFPQDATICSFRTIDERPNRLKILVVSDTDLHVKRSAIAPYLHHFLEQGHLIYVLRDQEISAVTRSVRNAPLDLFEYFDLKGKIFDKKLPKEYRDFDIILSEFGDSSRVCLDLKNKGVRGKWVTVFSNNNVEAFWKKKPLLLQALAQGGDAYIAVSSYGRQKLIQHGFDSRRIVVCYQGAPFIKQSVSSKIPDQQAPVRVLVTAGSVPDSGLKYALHAIAALAPRFNNLVLTIVGTGPSHVEFVKLASSLNISRQVEFLRDMKIKDKCELFNKSHVLLYPAIHASDVDSDITADLTLAISLGLPVITTRSGGLIELVEDGVNGLIVADGNSQAIARALSFLLENRAQFDKLGSASFAKAASFLNMRKICLFMEKELMAICARK